MERSPAVEDYLRAIYLLQRVASPVATNDLARDLNVAAASVTGMLKRLHGQGLVSHERYSGVTLTPDGERAAIEVIRHHRLIETYLAEKMGVAWDQVHEEAHRLEHHISESLEDRMAEILGHPERDPHGAPIPPKTGPFVAPSYRSLDQVQVGETVVVREVADEDAARLRRFAELGLRPDVSVSIEGLGRGGTIRLRIGEVLAVVDGNVAAGVWVDGG